MKRTENSRQGWGPKFFSWTSLLSSTSEPDIGEYCCQSGILNKQDKLIISTNHWKAHRRFKFPVREGQKRRCQETWFKSHSWLAYSQKEDGLFCKHCVLFSKTKDQFYTQPFTNWKHATDKMGKHAANKFHKEALMKSINFQERTKKPEGLIDILLNKAALEQIEKKLKVSK